MRKTAIFALILSAAFLRGGEFKLWGRITFEEPELKFKQKNQILNQPSVPGNERKHEAYFALRVYPLGQKSHLAPLKFSSPGYGEFGRCISFEPIRCREIILLQDYVGDMQANPDLYVAFCLWIAPGNSGSFALNGWNQTKNRRFSFPVKTKPGWNFYRIKLYAPGSLDLGDKFHGTTVYCAHGGEHSWRADNFVYWQGKCDKAPEQVRNAVVTPDGNNNVLNWERSASPLFIRRYNIHRGSVSDFKASEENKIGETALLSYRDVLPMRTTDYYQIIAEDAAGNLSHPSAAVRRK